MIQEKDLTYQIETPPNPIEQLQNSYAAGIILKEINYQFKRNKLSIKGGVKNAINAIENSRKSDRVVYMDSFPTKFKLLETMRNRFTKIIEIETKDYKIILFKIGASFKVIKIKE